MDFVIEQPGYGQLRVPNNLEKQSIFVYPSGVHLIWLRHDLETFTKRLKALEAKAARDERVLTGVQLEALEQTKEQKQAHDKIETEHLGYLRAQATFYVGILRGVEGIYQQTCIDTYPKSCKPSCMTTRTRW